MCNVTTLQTVTTLQSIKAKYPNTSLSNSAESGYIPIQEFTAQEHLLRPIMRANNLKAIYRGPRPQRTALTQPSMTRRVNATHVVLYANT